MVCKVGMSLYCIQILHAKLGSFENEKKNCGFGFFWVFCFFFFLSWHLRRLKVGTLLSHTHMRACTHPHSYTQRKESGNIFCVLLNLIRNCAFYCLKKRVNKKDYLNISHFKKKKKDFYLALVTYQ